MKKNKSVDQLLIDLRERAKELNCIYEIQQILTHFDSPVDIICKNIIEAIPAGWQYPEVCNARIEYYGEIYKSQEFEESEWVQCAVLKVRDEVIGKLCVCYVEERPTADEGVFLKEERKLIENIADQYGLFILHKQLKSVFEEQELNKKEQRTEWEVILDLLKGTDSKLLIRISRKMVNFLCWSGIREAEKLFSPAYSERGELLQETNSPFERKDEDLLATSYKIFEIAAKHLNEEKVLSNIQKWIREDRTRFLVNILESSSSSLADISSAIERFHHLAQQGLKLSFTRRISFRVALIRRLLSDQLDFINIAKEYIFVNDFTELMQRIIYPISSHGKIGGKSSGLFLAKQILNKFPDEDGLFENIKVPKTWYITSDGLHYFMKHNNLEDIIEQKYKDIGQVRQEYPYIVHVFKSSTFPPEIIQGLSLALNDLGDGPLIVRSSSLLEDRLGSAFAGKYKSLFISNQGTKEERLLQLVDAIAEVYASTFGPDPIQYRTEQGLLNIQEEMGILIQEVVGQVVGDYFFPSFGGVAFSNNEFRWSSRIKREDGLIRIVPGLGTRAVDRLSDDYPILIAPGKPNLSVNVSIEETIRYSPKYVDVVNLKTRKFETVDLDYLLKTYGSSYPGINKVVSKLKERIIEEPRAIGTDYTKEKFIVTFNGLTKNTEFIKQIHAMLNVLEEKYNHSIDIEFAHDGESLYLLQCRSQSNSIDYKPADIPEDLPKNKLVFNARKHISNGIVDGITHLVYVDPQKYSEVSSYDDLLRVGEAIGRLNKILPKRQFILMGPGRWGSRGDIKLGVHVTYSEINNTAMLIEIARKQKDYVPDLSFGTHFFQDLVEANIRYLPLYPDDTDIIFNENFFDLSNNILGDLFPDCKDLSSVIRVIDIAATTEGNILQVRMNADEELAVAFITERGSESEVVAEKNETLLDQKKSEVHWRWRMRNVEGLASKIDSVRFGVKGFYLFGSTKNATARPNSDINIIIHFDGNESQLKDLNIWLDGWSLSLSQMNYLRTGYKTNGMLDIHIITDKDIKNKTSYAVKIGAITDAARPLPIGNKVSKNGKV